MIIQLSTVITVQYKKLHTSLQWRGENINQSYGVSFAGILEKIYFIITAPYCINNADGDDDDVYGDKNIKNNLQPLGLNCIIYIYI